MLFPPVASTKRPLRDYQQVCVETVLDRFNQGDRKLYYKIPTGGGKTRVAAALIEKLASTYDLILFLAHRKELIWQTRAGFQEDIPGMAGIGICMSSEKELDFQVIVGTIQTVSRGSLEYLLDKHSKIAVFIDECHHIQPSNLYGKLISRVIQHNSENAIIGCTATDLRADNKPGLTDVLECCFTRSIEDLQNNGYLAPTTWMPIHVGVDYSRVKTATVDGETDYSQSELAVALYPSIWEIVDKTISLIEKRPTVCFTPDVKMAQDLADAYNERLTPTGPFSGLIDKPAAAIWGTMPKADRDYILKAWKQGRIQIVTNCGILTEGFDYPNLGCIVNAKPTQSPGLYLQMAGRVTRLKSGVGYSDGRIIDVCGNANLLTTRQIVLPKLQESISEREEEILESPAFLDTMSPEERIADPLGEQKERKDSTKRTREKIRKILDPLQKSWIEWGREAGYYYAGLGNDSLAVIKHHPQSGLWQPWVLSPLGDGHSWRHDRVIDRPTDLGSCMQHLNHVVAQNGYQRLINKDAHWRQQPASQKACKYLYVAFSKEEGATALRESWTAGYVSLRISYWRLQPLIKYL